jgi:hypothetical protein
MAAASAGHFLAAYLPAGRTTVLPADRCARSARAQCKSAECSASPTDPCWARAQRGAGDSPSPAAEPSHPRTMIVLGVATAGPRPSPPPIAAVEMLVEHLLHRSHGADLGGGDTPSRNADTQASSAALKTAAPCPQPAQARRAMATAGKACSSRGRTSRCWRSTSRSPGQRPRCDPASPGPGQSAVACGAGWPGPASSRPELAIECRDRLRMHDHVDPIDGRPKSRCASMTSALVRRVAELMVTSGPMGRVGCRSACWGHRLQVCPAHPGRARPRPSGSAGAPRPGCRRASLASAECSESTGTIWSWPAMDQQVAADDQGPLLGQGQDPPAAGPRRWGPGRHPAMQLRTTSAAIGQELAACGAARMNGQAGRPRWHSRQAASA